MKNYLNKYTLVIAVAFLLIGRFVLHPKQKIVETVKTVEVVKEVKVEEKKKKEVKTEIIKPDGTKETRTETSEDTNTSTEFDKTASSETKKKIGGPRVIVGILAIKNTQEFSQKPEFAITVTAPIFGSLKAQAIGTTDKQVGSGVAIEF